ncbi:hypothetical protein F01_380081 [Burkholderia cenocepacia]|nr:hypothetical protein F01_380081 [Burkholderia cenocepacia]
MQDCAASANESPETENGGRAKRGKDAVRTQTREVAVTRADAPSKESVHANEKALLDSVQQRFGVRALCASIVSSFSTCKFVSRCIRTKVNLKEA